MDGVGGPKQKLQYRFVLPSPIVVSHCHLELQNAKFEKSWLLFPNRLFLFRQVVTVPRSIDGSNLQKVQAKDKTPLRTPKFMVFVHDNVRPHTVNIVKQFLETKGGGANRSSTILTGSLFSLRLPIPRFKLAFKGKRFVVISDIQPNVTRLWNSI
ncbi:hypothetical protein TNCV_2487101 [Trichonephila clavipes]|uniref:Transposase n=1 Tax=Trichonephila clavipes TaxID=2585209 RepID=A0A8X7BB50_TRICX|nr:hypothetical protein TNCV_2487101 [Trichonephila clavipes]